MTEVCGNNADLTLFRRSSAIWTCISLGVPPTANHGATLPVVQAAWDVWRGAEKVSDELASGRPPESVSGLLVGRLPRAYGAVVTQLKNGILGNPVVGIVEPRVEPTPNDAWYATFTDPVP
jgi:hypothetical protein